MVFKLVRCRRHKALAVIIVGLSADFWPRPVYGLPVVIQKQCVVVLLLLLLVNGLVELFDSSLDFALFDHIGVSWTGSALLVSELAVDHVDVPLDVTLVDHVVLILHDLGVDVLVSLFVVFVEVAEETPKVV